MGRDGLETARTDNVHFKVLLKGKQIDRVAASKVKGKVLVAQLCPTLCDPMDCNPSAPLSMEFSRQEYWSGLPFKCFQM